MGFELSSTSHQIQLHVDSATFLWIEIDADRQDWNLVNLLLEFLP